MRPKQWKLYKRICNVSSNNIKLNQTKMNVKEQKEFKYLYSP